MSEPGGEVIVYRSPDGQSLVQLRAVAGTVWLAQAQIAPRYDTSVPNRIQTEDTGSVEARLDVGHDLPRCSDLCGVWSWPE